MSNIHSIDDAASSIAQSSMLQPMPPMPRTAPVMAPLPNGGSFGRPAPMAGIPDENPMQYFAQCNSVPEVANMIAKGNLPQYFIQVQCVAKYPRRRAKKRQGGMPLGDFLSTATGRLGWEDIINHIKAEREPGRYVAWIRAEAKDTTQMALNEAKRLEKLIPEGLKAKYSFEVGSGSGGSMSDDDPVAKAEDEYKIIEIEAKKVEATQKLEEAKEAREAKKTAVPPPLDLKAFRDDIRKENELTEMRRKLEEMQKEAAKPKTDVAAIVAGLAGILGPIALAIMNKPVPPPPPPPDNSLAIKQLELQIEQMRQATEQNKLEATERRAAEDRRAADERARQERADAERREDSRRQHEMFLKMMETQNKPKDKGLEDRVFDLLKAQQSTKGGVKEMVETVVAMREAFGGFGGGAPSADSGSIWERLIDNIPAVVPFLQQMMANPQAAAQLPPADRAELAQVLPPPMPPQAPRLPAPNPMAQNTRPVAIPPPLAYVTPQTTPPAAPVAVAPVITPTNQVPATEAIKDLLKDPVEDTREAIQECLKLAVLDIQTKRQEPQWIHQALADLPKECLTQIAAADSGAAALEYMKFVLNNNSVFDLYIDAVDKIEGRYTLMCQVVQLQQMIKDQAAAPTTTGAV